MPRTIISLTQEDKEWLAQRARAEHVPVTELVRRAIRLYRQRSPEVGAPSFEDLTERTAGIWEAGDGLAYQERLRAEWERESWRSSWTPSYFDRPFQRRDRGNRIPATELDVSFGFCHHAG